MFTGLVQAMGSIRAREDREGDVRIDIAAPEFELAIGGSIAVDGCCLTVVELSMGGFSADVSRETLALTTLGGERTGPVNLELPLTAGDALGGHLVTGHVDGIAHLVEMSEDARSVRMRFAAPRSLARYIARKGSVCLAGVSLTVNSVDGIEFEVNLVPHTMEVTSFGQLAIGDGVNLEVDLVARYLERLLEKDGDRRDLGSIDRELLVRTGFIGDP